MTEIEKLRLELLELKVENIIESSGDYGSWSKERQISNFERIKEIEDIFYRIPKKLIDIDKSNITPFLEFSSKYLKGI